MNVLNFLGRLWRKWILSFEWEQIKTNLRMSGCRCEKSTQRSYKNLPIKRTIAWYRCGNKTIKVELLLPDGEDAPRVVFIDKVEVLED